MDDYYDDSSSWLGDYGIVDFGGYYVPEFGLGDINLSDFDLSGLDFGNIDLSGIDLSGIDLGGIDLSGTDLSGIDLGGTDLSGIDLGLGDITGITTPTDITTIPTQTDLTTPSADITDIIGGTDLTGTNVTDLFPPTTIDTIQPNVISDVIAPESVQPSDVSEILKQIEETPTTTLEDIISAVEPEVTQPPVSTVVDNKDGTYTQTFDDGSTITVDKNSNIIDVTPATETITEPVVTPVEPTSIVTQPIEETTKPITEITSEELTKQPTTIEEIIKEITSNEPVTEPITEPIAEEPIITEPVVTPAEQTPIFTEPISPEQKQVTEIAPKEKESEAPVEPTNQIITSDIPEPTDVTTKSTEDETKDTTLQDLLGTDTSTSTTEEDIKDSFWKDVIGTDTSTPSTTDITDMTDTTDEDIKDNFWKDLIGTDTAVPSTTDLTDTSDEDAKDKFWKDIIGTDTAVSGQSTIETVKYDDGSTQTIKKNADGTEEVLDTTSATDTGKPTTSTSTTTDATKNPLTSLLEAVGGSKNASLLAALLGGIFGLMSKGQTQTRPSGYRGGIPKYVATRGPRIAPTEGGRRPGGAGIPSMLGGLSYTKAAQGGLMGLSSGGDARPARYLRGGTDGMADKIKTNIDGSQPARLSHGEFVIPADVVSHLGNGNSDAGADVLYEMMSKVRKARTGTSKQGKQINPKNYIPA